MPNGKMSPIEGPGHQRVPEPEEADYSAQAMEQTLGELVAIAEARKLGFLSYLLQMARLEALSLAKSEPRKSSGKSARAKRG